MVDSTFAAKLRTIQFAGAVTQTQVHVDRAADTKSVEILDAKGRSAGANIHHADGIVDSHVVVHDPIEASTGSGF